MGRGEQERERPLKHSPAAVAKLEDRRGRHASARASSRDEPDGGACMRVPEGERLDRALKGHLLEEVTRLLVERRIVDKEADVHASPSRKLGPSRVESLDQGEAHLTIRVGIARAPPRLRDSDHGEGCTLLSALA